MVVRRTRGESSVQELSFGAVCLTADKMDLKFPTQLFINNQFVDSVKGGAMPGINPTTEEAIWSNVQVAIKEDVDQAVKAAKMAFQKDSECAAK